jgi:hypothetical protein
VIIVKEGNRVSNERLARCDCGRMEPSNPTLPFFELNESNFEVPQALLDDFWTLLHEGWNQGYSGNHTPGDPKTFPRELQDRIEEAKRKISKARKYDRYYCGCRGWE